MCSIVLGATCTEKEISIAREDSIGITTQDSTTYSDHMIMTILKVSHNYDLVLNRVQ
jgi:hypothetical protein